MIDNGSHELRAGYHVMHGEDPYLKFRSVIGKPKTCVNKLIDQMCLVGNECNEIDPQKLQKRSVFDRNVVYHLQSMEHLCDYTFSHLGLHLDKSVEYPILMTEAMCNPNYSRSQVSELLFECYQVPAVVYAVDSLLAMKYLKKETGLVIDSSASATHVIPVFNSEWSLGMSKRLMLGGA